MPIHGDWISMIRAMAKQYKTGPTRCYPKIGGGKVCATQKAWSVFYAKVTKQFGKKAYMKARTRKKKKGKKAQESMQDIEGMKDELGNDIYIDWITGVYELDKK